MEAGKRLRFRVLGGYVELHPRYPEARFIPLANPLPRHCPKCAQERGVPIPSQSSCPHWRNGEF